MYIKLAHFKSKPMYEMKNFDDLVQRNYDEEIITISPADEGFVHELLHEQDKFIYNHASTPDNLYISLRATED